MPAGELWHEKLQVGLETTYGTAVTPTRIFYAEDPKFTRDRPANMHRFSTGTRERLRDVTLGATRAGGSFKFPMSADELLEILLVSFRAGVTPTTPTGFTNGRLWSFTPAQTVSSMTVEESDGVQVWTNTGVRVNKITIAGSVSGQNEITVDLFNKDKALKSGVAVSAATNASPIAVTTATHGLTTGDTVYISGVTGNTAANGQWQVTVTGGTTFTLDGSTGNGTYGTGGTAYRLTSALTERVPTYIEGWETRLLVDTFGGTAGTTLIAGTLVSWNIEINFNLGRKYLANNTLALNALTLGDIETAAKLVFEAVSPQAYTEFSNWDAETKRLVRLEFGQNEIIDTGTNEVQTLDVTGTVSGGTFTISHMGNTTPTLAYNISNANLTSALEALPSIGAGNVTVGGGPLPTDTTVTFSGNLAGRRIGTAVTGYSPASPLTVTTALTGGGSLAVVQTTPGTGSRRAVAVDLPGIWTAFDLTGDDEGTRTYELELTGVYDTTNSFLARILCINNRTAAW
jgi:hypothetical protein